MLIAFSGRRKSGKDTCADYLVKQYGFIKHSFATPLKDMASETWGIPRDWFEYQKETPLTQFPAHVEDEWMKQIMSMLYCHLRSESGWKPQSYIIRNRRMIGVFHRWTWFAWLCACFRLPFCTELPLFHTPRSLLVNEGGAKRAIDPDFWIKKAFVNVDLTKPNVFADLRFQNETRALRERDAVLIRVERFDTTTDTDASEHDLDHYVFDHYINNRAANHEAFDQCDTVMSLKP
jgi:hypothetical protein